MQVHTLKLKDGQNSCEEFNFIAVWGLGYTQCIITMGNNGITVTAAYVEAKINLLHLACISRTVLALQNSTNFQLPVMQVHCNM